MGVCVCRSLLVVRGQLGEASSLLPLCPSWRLNSGPRPQHQFLSPLSHVVGPASVRHSLSLNQKFTFLVRLAGRQALSLGLDLPAHCCSDRHSESVLRQGLTEPSCLPTCCVARDESDSILLPPPAWCWDDRCATSHLLGLQTYSS